MLTYEQTMALGQTQYQDVIDALSATGMPTTFTQTGGMSAALEVLLDGGHSLLITDADESLSWSRAEHVGWGVCLYPPADQYDGTPVASATTGNATVQDLLVLVRQVLREAVQDR